MIQDNLHLNQQAMRNFEGALPFTYQNNKSEQRVN